MHLLFIANHVKLLNACYPPTPALLTDYSPNSHELSRLTYYASNHPGKLAKIGSELEKRLKVECRKAKAGNIRSKASLLTSLSIFRSLATECGRDIDLLSPSLVGSVNATLTAIPSDLEVLARAASVFTAWTTYTNGHLIGADSYMTKDYLSTLKQFASLSCCDLEDQETRNRSRLIGLAALTAALNSEALYNDVGQFGSQVSTILHPIMVILFQTTIVVLDEQSSVVKDAPMSPYLAEFRTRPALERRAASIHVHIDGDNGPSISDVSDAALRALFSLLSHANGAQLGYIMQSSFDSLDQVNGWSSLHHCCWFAQKTAEWAQYQYRYVIPTWLVDRLLVHQDTPDITSLHIALTAMVTAVFSSPTPLINLSSSDIMSNLLTLLLRRISIHPQDAALPALVECISSLGCHVYYSDQIQDLAAELIHRLVVIEAQGTPVRDKDHFLHSRSTAIRCLLEGLLGLIRTANTTEPPNNVQKLPLEPVTKQSETTRKGGDESISRRTKVPPDIWQDTLSLLCDSESTVRNECSAALIYYIIEEMPKHGENNDALKHARRLADNSPRHIQTAHAFPRMTDTASKFLNALHAYVYILATSPALGTPSNAITIQASDDPSSIVSATVIEEISSNPRTSNDNSSHSQSNNRRSWSNTHGPRARKESLVLRLLDKIPSRLTTSAQASEQDYANLLKILTTVQVKLPIRGLLVGLPMILALDTVVKTLDCDSAAIGQIIAIRIIIAHVWLTIGQVWTVHAVISLAEKAISLLSSWPEMTSTQEPANVNTCPGVDTNEALLALTACRTIHDALGIDQEGLHRRLTPKWTPDLALRDFESSSGYETTLRGDGISPLLKISPALMHIENISLQSLTRSTRGLGVTDLREALEGRSSMSNPALVRPPSISTLDHASSFMGGDPALRLTQTRSRSRTKKLSSRNAGEVRDVLSRLGIGKQNNAARLKSPPPALPKLT
ncbi:hypothetical protein BYT27DRAFT_7183025 [Phlegmacium glaucopus]|nr:hypothetical protein BYT27DRAFT_7183025 [Phlegmacium glaucopus]